MLEVEGLEVRYGAVRAVRDASLLVAEGELVTSGEVTDLTIADAGLSEEPIVTQHVPALGAQSVALLAVLLALSGTWSMRRGLMGTSSQGSRWYRR